MALADRFYMREGYHPPRVTTRLIVVLVSIYLIQSLLFFYGDLDISLHLALSVRGVRHGEIWQLLTFQFLHAFPWPWHVLFNCIALYFFGRRVEEMLGARKYLMVYLLSGLGGGLLQVLTTAVLPRHADGPVVGASAGVCGLIAIYCAVNPMAELTTWIYFLPITIRARYFLWFLTGISIFGTLIPFDGVANAAHLGGILVGLGYVRYGLGSSRELPGWVPWPLRRERQNPVGSLAKNSPRRRPIARARPVSDFISREVDPILEKIAAQGIHSLTDKERKILEAARKRMEPGQGL